MQPMYTAVKRLLTRDKDKKRNNERKFQELLDTTSVCVVTVDTLRCMICLNIYAGIPQTLNCGHSFCSDCIKELVKTSQENASALRAQCPVCRKNNLGEKPINNYTMKAVLDSIHLISENEEKARKAYDATIASSTEQWKTKCITQERQIESLKREMNELKKKETFNYVAIAFFIMVYIILTTMYGY